MNIVDELKNDSAGMATLMDWLGVGMQPVHPMVAEFRAQRCIRGNNGKPCPRNKAQNWWNLVQNAKNQIAHWIRREIEMKERMNVRVPDEDKLFMCSACGCAMVLKVHTPIHHIKEHLVPGQLAKMPDYCWVRKELHH